MPQSSETMAFRRRLRAQAAPLRVRRAGGISWDDEADHRAAFARDPVQYALEAVAPGVQPEQQARVLYLLLEAPPEGLPAESWRVLQRVAGLLGAMLPADDVLTVFLALRRRRVNRKHAGRFILRYLLNHPCLEDFAQRRRAAVIDCLEHAAGRDVVRGCARRLREGDTGAYVQRNLLRFARDPDRARAVVAAIYGDGLPAGRGRQKYALYHERFARPVGHREMPKTVTATNRGDIAATLVHLYRGGPSDELSRALDRYADQAAARLPKFAGSVALVLDLSASTQGYGEREYCCASQSVALAMVLQRCCSRLRVCQVGGSGSPPRPAGNTDLAAALLDALAEDPDVVAIVSDGYENVCEGDLARVVASLGQAGLNAPVVFCHNLFTWKDDLTLRRPAPELPELAFWHENDFDEVLYGIFTMAKAEPGRRFARDHLLDELAAREKEVIAWTNSN